MRVSSAVERFSIGEFSLPLTLSRSTGRGDRIDGLRDVLIPPPDGAAVWIDFDGTITRTDVLDELIRQFAVDDSWRDVEAQWQAGEIGSGQCLARQLAVVRVADAELDPFLATIELDPGVVPLVDLLDRFGVPATVVSDGLDRFIHPLLARAGLGRLAVRCNQFLREPGDRVALAFPHGRVDCLSASAHCKCGSIAALSGNRPAGIYIGDGRSDLCPSRRVGCRFAKGTLAANLTRERMPFVPFDTLADVAAVLDQAWANR